MEEKISIKEKILNCKIIKHKEFSSVITIIGVLLFAFTILNICKLTSSTKEEVPVITTNKAEEYFYEGKYDKAIEEYKKLQETEEWPMYSVKIAEVVSVSGDIDKSNNILEESVVKRNELIDKNGIESYENQDIEFGNYVALTYLMNGTYDKALEYGEFFMNDHKDNKEFERTMFTIYMANGKLDEAKGILDGYSVDEESSYDLALYAKMNILVAEWDKGFDLLKNAWYKNKDEIKVYDVIAQISAYNRNEVIMKISDLSKKSPNELCYKVWLTKCYSMLETTTNEASTLLNEIKDEDLGQTVFKTVIAKIYQHSAKKAEAEKILSDLSINGEESYIGYHNTAWYYLEMGDYDKAFEYCKKSIVLNKDYPDNYGFLIPEIMEKSNKGQEVEPYFRTAMIKEPFNYNIMLKIADYYWNTEGNSKKAYSYFELASFLKPSDGDIYYNMALTKLKEGDIIKTVELLKKSSSIDEISSKYHRTLSTVYVNEGNNKEALNEIKKAYSLDENDILTLNNAGCYYISIDGDLKRGIINLKAAYNGLTSSTDQDTRKIIEDNYNKAKTLNEAYNKNKGEELQVPDFQLFY